MRKRSAGRHPRRGLGLASALPGALAAGLLLAASPVFAGSEGEGFCESLLEARRAKSDPPPRAPAPPRPVHHPGISFHELAPFDTYDYHQYDYERHQRDKLAGTSRTSRAPSLFEAKLERSGPQPDEPEAEPGPEPRPAAAELPEAAEEHAWLLLRLGDADEARRAFAPLARGPARTALPSVGFALAAAESGDLERGVSAMRRAFLDDAESVRCAPVDQRMRARLLQLVERYSERPAGEAGWDADFMRAALYYLLEELSAAELSIERAIRKGDQSPSATSLQREVQRRLLEAL